MLPCSGYLPAGVDSIRGSEETVRSRGMLGSANDISDVVGDALPIESTSQTVHTRGHGTKSGVPPRKVGRRTEACE